MSENKILQFPDGFLWGVSTSAYQIEGGIKNDWSEWEKSPARIKQLKKDGKNLEEYICGQACDSYNRFEEDLKCIKELNVNVYRFSIEWSRIEPEEGKWNEEVINYYKNIISKLKENNIEPFITIWHYTLPLWVSNIGGWENKKTINYFLAYANKLFNIFKEEVIFWQTFNEPEIYIGFGYINGNFPPNVKNLFKANKVFKNLVEAQKKTYQLIHKINNKTKLGVAHNITYQTPYKNNFINKLVVKIIDYIKWKRFLNKMAPYEDFIGLQYYHHDRLKLKLGGEYLFAESDNENTETNEMGWEIFPEGIYQILLKLKKYNLPIYITENGTADSRDENKTRFIINHLKYIYKAMREEVDLRGYFYWSLLDNFEWAHGWAPKFGLYAVDRETFKRTARPSAKIYAEICKNNGFECEG